MQAMGVDWRLVEREQVWTGGGSCARQPAEAETSKDDDNF